ncbi:MAG: trans-sulfuration enzyme family protein [Acidimicrobiales bacterium]
MSGTAERDRLSGSESGFTTRAVHGAGAAGTGVRQAPSSVPIYQTSTWRFSSGEEFAEVLSGDLPGYAYGRGYGNPTVDAFEAVMASLEGTEAAFAFSSGMSAIHAVCVALARSGDRIVASRELYGGTYSLFGSVLPRYGIEVEQVDPHDLEAVRRSLPGAALFYCETIANPLCTVADLPALGAACRDAGVPGVVDNTFASPYLCNPVDHGFDFVIHSVTKMIAGHSDVVAGVVCCSAAARSAVRKVAIDTGGAMPPFEAWLCLRGAETLELRMERMCENALSIATMLAQRAEVEVVHYPGLEGHAHHERAAKLLSAGRFGSMLAFELVGGAGPAARWCEALELAWIGASLGGTHTLVCHPASTTHRQVPAEIRRAGGLRDGLIRVSAGIENTADLLADFEAALARL